MATITDFDPNNFEVVNDFDPNDFEVVEQYRPSRGALELERDFLRQQEQEPDQRSFFDAIAIGANRGLAGLQSSIGGAFNLVGLPDFGDVWQTAARQREQGMADVSGTLAGQNPNLGLEWAEHASAIAPQQLPTVAAGAFGGLPGAMLMAGLQTAGSTQDAAQQAYEAQGLAREEAISRSRMPALTSGAITALLTGLVPGRWGEGITAGGRTAVQQAKQSVYETARRIFTEAAKEAPEEIIDELAQGAVAKFTYDPDRPMSEILMDAWEAGGWGAATAGAVGTVGMAANALSPRPSSEIRDYLDEQRNQSVEDFAESEPHFRDMFDPNDYEIVPVKATPSNIIARTPATMQEFQNPPPRVQQPAAPAEFWPDDFEVIDEPPTFEFSPAPEASAPSAVQPIEATEQVRNLLLTNMQGRSMDISPESFATPDAHIISVLGQRAPSWQQLAQAGIVQATPNANGTVNVRVAPVETSVIHSESSITPTPVETTQPASPTTVQPDSTVQPVFWEASTPFEGVRIKGGYEVVDADELVSSFDKGFDQSLQPRDRDRAASQQQILDISTRLDPSRLGDSPTTDLGAPIIDENNQVISGNGRTASIRRSFEIGGGPAALYTRWLLENAPSFGIDRASISGMKKPVLVRRIADLGGLTKQQFAEQSNRQQVLGRGEAEAATADARLILSNPQLIEAFRPSEEGDVLAASNRDFLKAFVQGTGDQASLLTKDGFNGPAVRKRVRNAILGAIIGPENRQTLSSLLERGEELGVSNAVNGLMTVAPSLARLVGTQYDLTGPLAQAAQDLIRVKSEGVRVEDFLAQSDLFGNADRSSESDRLLIHLANSKSAKATAQPLAKYAQRALSIDTATEDIFGETNPTRSEMLASVYEPAQQSTATQAGFSLGEPSTETKKSTSGAKTSQRDIGTSQRPNEKQSSFFAQNQVATAPEPSLAADGAGIADMVETSRLPQRVKAVMVALLESKAMQGLDFSQLRVELTNLAPQGQLSELGARIGNLIQISEQADEKTFAHEIAHVLHDALPAEVKAQVEAARVAALPPNADPSIAAGQMTSEQFAASGLPIELYPFSNSSEFLAHAFSNKFAQRALAKADPTLIGKLKVWLNGIYRAVKQAIGLGSVMDRIVQDLIDGKYVPTPQTGAQVDASLRQSTFVMSAAEAQNAANLATDQKIEGESLLAQSSHIVDLLDRFNVGALGSRIARAFDYRNWTTIRDIGEQLNQGRENYQQLKARLANDPYRRARLAGEAGQQILRFGEQLEIALGAGQRAYDAMKGGHLRRLIAKTQAASLNALAKEHLLTVSKSIFNSAISDAKKALKEEARTDLDIAALQGQIRGLREAAESTEAMEQLMNDIVKVVMSTSQGQTALFSGQGGGREIIGIYRDLKKSAGQTLHNENLLNWASYLLAKSPKLRDALQAANLSRQTGIRSQLQGFSKKFADDLRADPVNTIRRAMRDREKQVADATGAEFLFKQLNQELTREIEPLIADIDAGGIAAQIKADPQYQALRNEILNDQTSFAGAPAKPFKSATTDAASSTITLPSGRTIGIGHEVIDGNQATLRARWDEFNAATEELKLFLSNPANADLPERRLHEANLQTLEDYYAGQQALMPENRSPLFSHALSVLNAVVAKSSTRLAGSARAALRRADQMHKWARDWHDRWTHQLSTSQRQAMQSHRMWRTGSGLVQSNREYQQKVGQELSASWQRQQGGLKVGEMLSSGEIVTQADIDHLELQSKAGFEALNLAAKYDRQITEDARGLKNTPNYRHALRTSPFLVPRMFDYSHELLARKVAESLEDPAALEDALNRIWPIVGPAMLTDRNPEFAKTTAFDGPGNAFSVVAAQMWANPNSIPDIDTLAQELANHSTATKDQAKEIVMAEFGRIITQWSNAVQEKLASASSGGVKMGDAKNSFTQARGDAMAPWKFYRTGFTTSDDVVNHSTGMMSVSMDRVIDALEAIEKDLNRQESELTARVNELARRGVADATGQSIREKEAERRRGQTYDSWERLHSERAHVSRAISRLKTRGLIESEFDYTFARGSGALVGALIGNVVTTMRNLSPIFLGRQLRLAGMSEWRAALYGLGFSSWETAAILTSLSWGGVRSAGYLLRGMARGVPQLLKGEPRTAYHAALRDVIRELSQDVPRRLRHVRELERLGLYSLPEKVKEFDNQILGSLLYKGRIPSTEFRGAAKVSGYASALFESTVLAVATAAFPTVGDASINGAMHAAMNSSFGPIHMMQTRLGKLYADWKRNGYPRQFDLANPRNPVNRLSPSEVFGEKMFDIGTNRENKLSLARRLYEMASLSFDEEAAKYMAALDAGTPDAQFLSDEARLAMTDMMINQMNRAAVGNAPLVLKEGGTIIKLVRPLYGFPIRAFANWESTLSRPTLTDSSKAALWATTIGSVIIGLLLTGGGGQLRDEIVSRLLKRGLFNQESANRLPWEEPTVGRLAASVARLGMESVPLLGIVGNVIIPANSPARASYEPTLAVVEAFASAGKWIHGMIATGDPTHGMPELVQKFVPDAKAVINRMDSQEGRRLAANAVANIKRYAPPDLVRPFYKGSFGASLMSPHIEDMDNYAMTKDHAAFMRAYNQAVDAAREMKKADPEKTVQNAFRSRNPFTRALTRQMTESEKTQMIRKANAQGVDLGADILEAERRWASSAALIGIGQGRESSGARRDPGSFNRPPSLRRTPASLYRPRQQRRRY